MAQTGQSLYKYLQQVVGQAYSGYLDTFKADRIFNDALLNALETKYQAQDNQKNKDELSYIFSTNNIITPANNKLIMEPLQVTNVTVFSPTVFEITTFFPHNLTTGDSVTVSGVAGTLTMPTANGTFASTVINATKFQITVASATGVYTANTGKVITPSTITDYWHLLSLKAKFNLPIYDWTVKAASNTAPIVLTISSYNSFRTREKLVISGVVGNTAANGTFYIKVVNSKKIALYSDAALQIPVVGNGIYVSGGSISRQYYEYTAQYAPESKIGVLNIPTPALPAVDISDNQIKIYPLDVPCLEVEFDYVKVPEKKIVSSDNTTDLTLYYPEKFLLLVVKQAAQLFAEQVRDPELYQTQTAEKMQNP